MCVLAADLPVTLELIMLLINCVQPEHHIWALSQSSTSQSPQVSSLKILSSLMKSAEAGAGRA